MGQSFEDLEVWKRGCRLAIRVMKAIRDGGPRALVDQMNRAAISIPSNVAEGSERGSMLEFKRFINIALGSAAELRTQVYLAARIGLISEADQPEIVQECKIISRMLSALRSSLRVQEDVVEYDVDEQ